MIMWLNKIMYILKVLGQNVMTIIQKLSLVTVNGKELCSQTSSIKKAAIQKTCNSQFDILLWSLLINIYSLWYLVRRINLILIESITYHCCINNNLIQKKFVVSIDYSWYEFLWSNLLQIVLYVPSHNHYRTILHKLF